MTRLIEIARQWGICELVGEILRENEAMLQMCRELGFAITLDHGDRLTVVARKTLSMPQASGA
jgi:acetyltransferase